MKTLQAADALENPAPVAQVIAAWQHTAEVHADPDLAARIHLIEDDFGPVPEPSREPQTAREGRSPSRR